MDVSLRPGPLFLTGLLLGAAGAMSLGLHRPTAVELAAAASSAASTPVAAVPAPPAPVAQAAPVADVPERADEQMREAASAFRAQEAVAAGAAPLALAVAQPRKQRTRQVVKEADTETAPVAVASGSPTAAGPAMAPEPAESVPRVRSATSVMGAAPEGAETRLQAE